MTRPTSSTATTDSDRDLAGVEVDLDLGDGGRPAERRVGVAACRSRRRSRRPGTARSAGRSGSGRARGASARYASANGRPVRPSTCVAQPPRRLDRAARRRPSPSATRPSARSRARAPCPAARSRPSSTGTPSSAATSCGKIVFVPWPISVDAVRIRIAPSAGQLEARRREPIFASPEPVNPAPCQASASPMPRAVRSRAGRAASARRAARAPSAPGRARTRPPRRRARGPPRRRRSRAGPGRVGVTSRRAGRRSGAGSRAGEIPSASATRLTWISAANSACGAPKPRNAPFGGVFVVTARRPDPDVRDSRTGRRRGSSPRDRTTGRQRACTRRRP